MFKKVFILFAIASVVSLQATAKKEPVIGVRTLHYEDTERKRPVLVELWYPTEQQQPVDSPSDIYWIHPKEIRGATLKTTGAKYPLILLSHGHQGNRRDRSWLAEALVQNGFIVASIDHHGNTWHTYNPLVSLKFWERAKDVRFALDCLLGEPFLKGHLDANRIGFSGYSLGGMTGLAIGGGVIRDIKQVMEVHKDKYKELSRGVSKDLLSQIDFNESMGNFADPRIKALLLICPANFAYFEEELKEIKVPVGLIGLVQDEVLPYQKHIDPLISHLNPARLKIWEERISHYAFLNPISEIGKKIFPAAFYTFPPESEKGGLHRQVADFAVEFFREHLPAKEETTELKMCVNE